MFILLTKFICPIEKKIPLSKYFGFYFDNPRTPEEIELVRGVVKKSWDLSEIYDGFLYQRFPMKKEVPKDNVVTFESIIEQFCNTYFPKKKTREVLTEIEGSSEKIIDFYTKNWVIVRYDNPEMRTELASLKKTREVHRQKGIKSVFMLDDDHIFEERRSNLIDYSYLVSLISNGNDYFGWNFLLTDSKYEIQEDMPQMPIMTCILHQMIGIKSKLDDPSACQFNFHSFIKAAEPFIKLIDKKLKTDSFKEEEEFLLYIGNSIASSKPRDNEFSSLVRIVGIIEMLLTHQPDFNRFNVDESITKQFVLKTAIVANLANSKISLEDTKKNLKEIYTQRSNIVHGNFKEVNKFIKKLKKEERYFSELISNCYQFSRMCIVKYLEDPKFIKFLKES